MNREEKTAGLWIPAGGPSGLKKNGKGDPCRPYTVIDAIVKAYGRNFADDLQAGADLHPERFSGDPEHWRAVRGRALSFRAIRTESFFDQPIDDVQVEIAGLAGMELEEVSKEKPGLRRRRVRESVVRLRYRFDFRPCSMTCSFAGAVVNERDSLLSRNPDTVQLDRYLIPVLTAEAYEAVPDWIRENWFPGDRDVQKTIDPGQWILRMGIPLLKGEFRDPDIQGKYFFDRGAERIVDPETGIAERKEVKPGSIVLSSRLCPQEPGYRSAAAHEAAHAVLGRYFYCLQRLQHGSFLPYVCKRTGKAGRKREDALSPFERIEIQANTLPRYLLIPEEEGREHAGRLLAYYGGIRDLRNMGRLVRDMAQQFGTTKAMAKSRLAEFGYPEVRGILQSENGRLLPSYLSRLSGRETYVAEEADVIREMIRNPDLRAILASGEYLYVPESGCCCRNGLKYLFRDLGGKLHLTRYAREHMDECCLVFEQVPAGDRRAFPEGVALKSNGPAKGKKTVCYVGKDGGTAVTEAGRELRKKVEEEIREYTRFCKTFDQMTLELMASRHMGVSELVEKTGLSERTVLNMRSRRSGGFRYREVAAVCIALHLPPAVSREYIESNSASFDGTDVDLCLVRYMVNNHYLESVPAVNRMLVEAGARPMTGLVEGFDENGRKMMN